MTARLERHDDPRAALFVPLAVGFLDDVDVNDCGPLAQLVYVRSLLHAKRGATDGLVSLRQITGGLYGHVDAVDVQEAASELVQAGLWDATVHPDRFVITGWLKHNESSLQRSAERSAKRQGALRTNHGKGQHDGKPVDDCPLCQDGRPPHEPSLTSDETPGGSAPSAKRPHQRSLSAPAQRAQETETETETETEPSSSTATPRPDPASAGDDDDDSGHSAIASDGLAALGIRDGTPNDRELQAVARAQRDGASYDEIIDKAERARVSNADDVRAYWATSVENLAGEHRAARRDGTPAPGPSRQPPPVERRPLLDDERTPCDRCGGSNIVDVEGGGVDFCPDCAHRAATDPPPDPAFPDPHEGWDDSDTVHAGIANARAALPRNRPHEEAL